jgi:hypothetical protein
MPQLGIMVPVALLAARQWGCIASATATAVLMIVVAYWYFGAEAWMAWWRSLGDYVGQSDASTYIRTVSPTVLAIENMGISHGAAACFQVAAAIVSTAVVWISWRRLDPRKLQPAVLALCAATFLATPHALFYDLIMLSLAPAQYRLHLNCRNDPSHIAESEFAHAGAQCGVGTVARILQHHTARYARHTGSADLIERDLRLGREFDLLGNARLLSAAGISNLMEQPGPEGGIVSHDAHGVPAISGEIRAGFYEAVRLS